MQSPTPIGRPMSHYRVIEHLGSGGMEPSFETKTCCSAGRSRSKRCRPTCRQDDGRDVPVLIEGRHEYELLP